MFWSCLSQSRLRTTTVSLRNIPTESLPIRCERASVGSGPCQNKLFPDQWNSLRLLRRIHCSDISLLSELLNLKLSSRQLRGFISGLFLSSSFLLSLRLFQSAWIKMCFKDDWKETAAVLLSLSVQSRASAAFHWSVWRRRSCSVNVQHQLLRKYYSLRSIQHSNHKLHWLWQQSNSVIDLLCDLLAEETVTRADGV